jgi:hypothetical protein
VKPTSPASGVIKEVRMIIIGPFGLLFLAALFFKPVRAFLFYALLFFAIVWLDAVYHVLAPGAAGFVALGIVAAVIALRQIARWS